MSHGLEDVLDILCSCDETSQKTAEGRKDLSSFSQDSFPNNPFSSESVDVLIH